MLGGEERSRHVRHLLIWFTDHLAALSEWLYLRADERSPDGALSLDEIDEQYERRSRGWRVN